MLSRSESLLWRFYLIGPSVSIGQYCGLAVDVVVVGVAIMRVIGNVPLVSGHTLFLTYTIVAGFPGNAYHGVNRNAGGHLP